MSIGNALQAFVETFFCVEFNHKLDRIGMKKGVYFSEVVKAEYLPNQNKYRVVLMVAPKTQEEFDKMKIKLEPLIIGKK